MKKYFYLIGFLLIAIGLGFVFLMSVTLQNDIRAKRAEKIGQTYIEKVYQEYSILGEVCQGTDTDGDGYMSCTFRIGKRSLEKEVNLQCPTYIRSFLGNECKATQMVLPQ